MMKVPGHALDGAGVSYGLVGCMDTICIAFGGQRLTNMASLHRGGHARCECGEHSPHVLSNRERREWHRQHKQSLVAV